MTKTDVIEFLADVLFDLGLIKAWEWEYSVGIPSRMKLTWFWEDESWGR